MAVGALSLFCLIFSVLHTVGADFNEEPIYYTFNAKICDTPCKYMLTTCSTIDGSKGKCSGYQARRIRTGHSSSNKYFPCITPCDYYTKKCTILDDLEDCHRDDVIYYTNDYTEQNTYCVTPCLNYGGNDYRCYDSAGDWVQCAPFPNKQKELREMFRRINVYGAYTEHGYRRCGQCECSPGVHVKNSNHQYFTKDLTFNEINMTTVMNYYENEFPGEVIRYADLNRIKKSDMDPILSYNMMPVVGEWTDKGADQLFLPLMVTSLITNYTKPTFNQIGSKLPKRVERNYQKMDPAPGDERTYIIDHRFNGRDDMYNIFPGSRFLNRGQRSSWTYLNNAIAKFVHENVGASVYLKVILSYDFEDLYQSANKPPKIIMRPNAIGVNVRFYNNKVEMTDDRGVPLDDRPNPYENMFFSNNADHCCALDFMD